jgi:hypothetical protein
LSGRISPSSTVAATAPTCELAGQVPEVNVACAHFVAADGSPIRPGARWRVRPLRSSPPVWPTSKETQRSLCDAAWASTGAVPSQVDPGVIGWATTLVSEMLALAAAGATRRQRTAASAAKGTRWDTTA